ncbi:hypothetical protein ISS21_02475 [Patescibacteria group bacterium]|nr:hypothetical protein [Patescibacteria group bacterium]
MIEEMLKGEEKIFDKETKHEARTEKHKMKIMEEMMRQSIEPEEFEQEIELQFDEDRFSDEEIQKIEQIKQNLPVEIQRSLKNIPSDMILDAMEKLNIKIQDLPSTGTRPIPTPTPATDRPDVEPGRTAACPEIKPFDPEWCKRQGGKIIYYDEPDRRGCKRPPKCILPGDVEPEKPRVEPGEPISLPGRTEPCIQVITFAVSGGLCRAFPTPCDVPSGWRKVDKCPEKPSEAEARQPTQIIPEPTTIKALPQTEAAPSIKHVAPTTTGGGSGEGFKAPDDKGMMGPEGSLGKPSMFERFKKLFTR